MKPHMDRMFLVYFYHHLMRACFLSFKYVAITQLGILKIIRCIVNMGINGYRQLIDIVNFCGKQQNISSSKETHGSDLLSVVK